MADDTAAPGRAASTDEGSPHAANVPAALATFPHGPELRHALERFKARVANVVQSRIAELPTVATAPGLFTDRELIVDADQLLHDAARILNGRGATLDDKGTIELEASVVEAVGALFLLMLPERLALAGTAGQWPDPDEPIPDDAESFSQFLAEDHFDDEAIGDITQP